MSWYPVHAEVRSSGWSRIPEPIDWEEVDVGMVQSG